MRISQVMIGKGFGGGERCFVDSVLALAERGYHVQAVCHRDFPKCGMLSKHPNVEVALVRVFGAWDLLASRRIERLLARFGPDIVQTHLARGALLGGAAAHRLEIPCLATLHNYSKLKYYRFADRFICTTPDQQSYLVASGIEASRTAVIPNFSRVPPVRRLRDVPESRPRPVSIVTVGRLHQVKGYDVLLRAMRSLADRGAALTLTIAGDGPERSSLERLCQDLGLSDRVIFKGWVDDPISLLDDSDLYVSSSRSESFGISLLEAMARGLPIVSTECKGPSQLLSYDLAWFAPPEDAIGLADAIELAIADPLERQKRSQRLREIYSERYSADCVVPQLLAFYEQAGAVDRTRFSVRRMIPDFLPAISRRPLLHIG